MEHATVVVVVVQVAPPPLPPPEPTRPIWALLVRAVRWLLGLLS